MVSWFRLPFVRRTVSPQARPQQRKKKSDRNIRLGLELLEERVMLDCGLIPMYTGDMLNAALFADCGMTKPPARDTRAPTVTITNPANLVTHTSPIIVGVATDDMSGVATVEAQVDGGLLTSLVFDTKGRYQLPTALPLDGQADGKHTVRVRATDKAGNVGNFTTLNFTLDTHPPTVLVTSPAVGLLTNRNVTISGLTTDDRAGVALLQAAVDTGSFIAVQFDGKGHFSFTTALALNGKADQGHTVHLRATDKAGNISALTDFAFTLDTTLPAVHLTSPAAGAVSTTDVTIAGQTTDSLSGVASLQVQLDQGAFRTVTFDATGNFSFPAGLTPPATGSVKHTLRLRATDRAGNVFTGSPVSVTLVPPPLALTAHLSDDTAPGGTTNSDSITSDPAVAGTVSTVVSVTSLKAGFDTTPVGSFVDVHTALQAGGTFALDRTRLNQVAGGTLANGPHTLHLRATDANGKTGTFDLTFTLDTVLPVITITNPASQLVTHQNVAITGQVTDDRSGVASLQAALDGGNFAAVNLGSGGAFSLATTLLLDHTADGPHTEHLKATDRAGNVSFVDVSFTLDTVSPTINVTSPAPQLVTNQNVAITGQVTDDRSGVASLQAALDGSTFGPVNLGSGGAFSFPTNLLLDHTFDGPHTEHLKATDRAGNVSFFDVFFTLDTVSPTINVTSPQNGLSSMTNVTLTGQVTDDRSGVASLQAALDGGTFAGVNLGSGGAFSLATTLLLDHTADGPHTEHLKATDRAGNVSFLDVSFTLDTVSPTINVTSPAPQLVTNQNVAITGQVTDDRSGVASLQAALDGGNFAGVTLGSGGTFSFPTTLSLDHTADGAHTEHLKATDRAGNVSFFDVSFVLDTVSPTIAIVSPQNGLNTHTNITVTGQVSDDRSGVASLEEAVDGGTFAAVTFDGSGTFSFLTGLLLNGSADGRHTVQFRATDQAGNGGTSGPFSFTLDTIPPSVDFQLDPASDTAPVGDGHTSEAIVTLTGTTEPNTAVVLEETGATVTSDATTGAFSFTGVALALGDNTFTVQATDQAGNTATAQHTITRDSAFGTTLVEGTQFLTPLDQTFVVPAQPSVLEFRFANLNFDTRANFIKDAFEASLTDANGHSLVLPIAGSRDAFLNITEGQAPVLSPNVRLTGDTVDVDLSHLPAGTQAILRVRLVNNDSDTTTSVEVANAQVIAEAMNTPGAVTPAAAAAVATSSIDFSGLDDVTSSMTATYGQTSLNEQSDVLYVGLTLQNTGSYPVDSPLVAVITHLSDPSIHVRNSDGTTPEGLPYFDLSRTIAGSTLTAGQATGARTLAFFDPNGGQFTYDLVVLGHLNRPPAFTSEPNTEAIPGLAYVYQATASDPDSDALTFSLLTGPAGMTVDRLSGKVTWSPQQSDLGNQAVLLQVDDGHGSTAQQQFTVSTIVAPPNRPPLFASTPVVGGNVNVAYVYQATATDKDGDPLTFSLTSGPAGMAVDGHTGLVTWTPAASQLGVANVTIAVADGRGGAATQTYTVNILQDPKNQPPLITSDPVTQYNVPPASNPPAGNVNPNSIDLTLADGQTSNQTVSLTGLSGGPLTLGSLVTGNFGTPGQQDVYTFNLTANALLYFDALTNNPSLLWSLSGPNAAANVSNRPFTSTDGNSVSNPVLSLLPGAYTLTVFASDQTTGVYAFRLSNLAMAAPLTPGTPFSGTLVPSTSTNLYQFTAAAGQSFYFARLSSTGADFRDDWRLIDPYGNDALFTPSNNLASQGAAFLSNDGGRLTLTAAGTYTVLVEGFIKETAAVSYTLNVAPITDTTQPLVLGSAVNANAAAPGEQDSYTFNLSASTLLYFDALTNNGNFHWSLRGPTGAAVSDLSFTASDNSSPNPVLALPAGAYTLTVSATGATSGPYSFRLSDLATATALTPGTAVNGSLAPAISTNLYQFSAAAGQSFYFASHSVSGGTFIDDWRLIDPYGNVLFNSFLANDPGRLTLTATGTYTVLVEGYILDTSSDTYSFTVAPVTDTTQALALGSTINAILAAPGQQDRYTFNLAANALLNFDAQTNNDGFQWSLSGPAGTAVSNRSFTASDGRSFGPNPVLALPAGAYTLTISGAGKTAGAYAFRLSDLATATAFSPGTPVSGTLAPADSTNLHQFTANAGDEYTFVAQAVGQPPNVYWRLIDPYGNALASNFFGVNLGPVTLTATGTYTLLVEGFIADPGAQAAYTFTAQFQGNVPPLAPGGTPLTLGSTVNGALSTAGQQDSYTFNLAANALLYFDALSASDSLQWSLSGPTGTAVSNRTFSGSDGFHGPNNPVLALPAGGYTLTVAASGQATGAYSFRLSDLAAATALTPGTAVSDVLSPAISTNLYQFSAAAGQSFYFASLADNGGSLADRWRLIDPYGNLLFSTSLSNDAGRLTLAAGGTYTVLVEGFITDTGAVSYSFNVAPITDPTQALTLGSVVNATLAAPTEQDRYTFTLAANTLLYFDALTNNFSNQWSLSGPGGTVVSNRSFTGSDSLSGPSNPVLALPAGGYTLTVSATGQVAGAYAFRLSDLAAATALTPGTAISDSLSPAISTNLYQFSAAAGQSFYFASLADTGGSLPDRWRLIDPYGNVLFSTSLSNDAGRLTVIATGTYTLLVEGYITDTGTVSYSFNVAPVNDPAPQALTLGGAVNAILAAPGEQDRYTFTLAANAQLYFDALTTNNSLQWSLSGPGGTAVSKRSFNGSDSLSGPDNPVLALPAGGYTLTVSATGQVAGAYAFRLSDLAAATALTPGTAISDSLSPAISTNLYQFSAAAGQSFYFGRLSGSGGQPADRWRLIDPYGNVLFSTSLSNDAGRLTLAVAGTYTVLVEGFITDTGTVSYSFNVAPITDTTQPLALGSVVNATLAAPGEQDRYTFNLPANASLYFDALTDNNNSQWSLSGPAGTVVSKRFFNGSDGRSNQANPVLALPAGAYTLTVGATGQFTGAYSFRLSDLATATTLTPGTAVSGSLAPANSTNLYQFTASAGDKYTFVQQGGSGAPSAIWALIDPYGNVVFRNSLSITTGPVTLTASGTYSLLVEGFISDTGTGTYTFNVQFQGNVPPAAPSGMPLALGSTVNGVLTTAGQQDRYLFNLAANALLYFDALTNNGSLQWSLSGPVGTAVSNRSFTGSDSYSGPSNSVLTLPAGSYTLTVAAPGQVTGAYSFRLSDLATAVPLTINTPVGGRLSPGNSTNLHQFAAKAGDSFYFESLKIPFALGTSTNSAQWQLADPYGNILFTVNLGSDAGRFTLAATGTYTLLIEGAIQNTASMGYALRVDQPQVDVVPSDPNVPFVNQTGAVADLSAATFNVQLKGNGQAQGFDLQFVSPATGIELGSIPVSIDTQYLYQVRAVDPDGDPLTFQLTQAPSGMQIDATSGLITWIPTLAQVGQNLVSVRVLDDHGGVDTQSFVVNVTSLSPGGIQGAVFNDLNGDGGRNSVGGSSPPTGGPFQPLGTPFPAIGVDSGPAFFITIGPDGAITTTATGQGPYDASDDTYIAVVNQAASGVAVKTLHLTGNDDIFGFDGDGIDVGGPGLTGYEGPGTYFSDFNTNTLTSGNVNLEDGSGNGLQPGQQAFFTLEGVPTTVTATIITQVLPVALEPPLAGWTVYLDLNHNGQLDPSEPTSKTDALGHYFFSNVAPGSYTVAEVSQAGWQQTAPASGTYGTTVQSGQVVSGLDFGNQQLTTAVSRPPQITSTAPATAAAGQTYRYDVAVSNPDDDVLDFDLPVKPVGMVVDQQTGIIAWEPTDQQVGPQNVVLRLQDNKGDVVLQSFQINVGLEAAPVITSTPPQQPAVTGLPWQYQVQAQDAENDPLTYSLAQAPAGMAVNATTGLISWIGAPVGPGLPSGYQVTVQVSDGRGGQDAQTFTVLVITPGFDRPPVITSHPRTKIDFGKTPDFYQVVASDPDGDPLTYSLPTAPAGMTIDATGLLRWLPLQTDVGVHPVEIEVDDGRGLKATQDFTMTVTWQITNQGPAIVSVPPPSARAGLLYQYDAAAADPDGNPVIWSLDTAPAGMSLNPSTGTVRWTPTLDQLGSATVVLRVTDTAGGFSTQSFAITVRSGNTPPNILSSPPTQAAVGRLYSYAVRAMDIDGDPLSYSLTGAPAGMSIGSSSGVVQWAPTAGQVGPQQVIIDVDDGHGGGVLQGYTVVVSSTGTNQPPVVTSTPVFVATVNQPYTYQATASDPEGDALHFSLITAPAGTIVDGTSGLVQWTPDTTQLGANPVLLAVTDTAGNVATQNFTITAQSVNQPPAIRSVPVTTVTAGAAYEYDVMAVDPDNDPLTYTLLTAPTGMTIDALGRIIWSPQTGDIGSQPVQVSVSDGRGSTVSQQYNLAVTADTEPPKVIVTLGANPATLGTPNLAVVTATDNVGVTLLTLTLDGTPVPIDSMGRATLPDNTAGTFTLVATASDAAGNVGTASQTLTVINPQVTNSPVVALTTPANNAMVTAPTQVIGTVQDPNLVSYTLSMAPVGSDTFTTFFTGTSQVTNGVLGTFDPTTLQNDSYDLRLTATNTGGLSSTADITVNVSSKLKLGNFTLTFADLTIPVAGIPITITRTYNSLNADESEDFGYGWQLEDRDANLQTSVALTGMENDGFYNPFNVGSHVYVTLPGGQREGFTFQPTVASGLAGRFLGLFNPVFVPDAGITSSLTVAPANLRIDDDGSVYDFETGLPYNPADPNFGGSYLLTTNQGLAYSIDGSTRQLTEVSDSNNHTLTFSNDGVISSTGIGIVFQRDDQGRIAAIIDPTGNVIHYQYDPSGDLVAVTDRSNNTTQFIYLSTPAHYLNKVIDPLGRTGVRTDYNAQGQLTTEVDGAGNAVQIAYDPQDSMETTTDALGNTTTIVYDDRGNIIEQIDPLGGVTLRTFDANDNLLTETDPLGRTTSYTYDDRGDQLTEMDPLGNITIDTYQVFTFGVTALAATRGQAAAPFTRLATSTDPLGDTTRNSYDFFGNLVAQTDPIGNTTTMSSDAGLPTVITDPLGNVMTNHYDGEGNRTQLVDADGKVVNFTYDADGNLLSQTQADGSGWSVTYNADGRPTNIGLVGLPIPVQYDAANQITQITDPSGEIATLAHDALGHVTQVTLPDGTTLQSSTYDAVGNLVAVTDSLGNVTRYAYDADNRLVQTTYPDGSTEKDTYDLAGELVEVTDALGNSTRYVYDAGGRQIQTIDALGGVTSTQYDAAGRTVATTDPLGRTTRYQYDADGQQIATIAPDGSITRNVYDADGRLVQTGDAAGNVTTNGYDPAGHFVSLTDALGNVTSYQYNDDNGKAAMTDAKGNVTRYSYDTQGHLVQTTRPDGETDTSTYDSSGDLASTTNGDGQTIQYGYNARGEQTSLTLPDGSQETYTSTSDGLLSSVTDASGTTRYDYDPLTRLLVRVTEPDGRYIRYAYDAQGNRTLMADGMGAGLPEDVTQYAYDALGRLVQVTDPQGGVTNYTYDADGDLTTTTLPNGVTETDTYDTLNRLIAIVDKNASGATISSFTYTLDANGNRTREDDADGSYVLYTYDALNRVTSEEHYSSGGILTAAETYTYDALGNVTVRSGTLLGGASFTYNGDNQLVSGAGSSYAYDGAGNLVAVTDSSGQVTRYTYDARGRLISSQDPDGTITSYTYDFQGVRQSQQGPGGLAKYLVDEANGPGAAQVVRESDSTGATLRAYVIGARLLSFTEGGKVLYYLADGLGSIRLLTDQTGAVTDTYLYSAYGVLLGHTGGSDNPFLFAGQDQDGSSGLLYLRARYYDPATGRFLGQDALPGSDQLPLSLNKYLYCLANPVNGTDPSGNQDLAEQPIAEAGEAQEDEAEAEVDESNLDQGLQVICRFLQFDGGLLTLYAAEQALQDPYKLGAYFGGYGGGTSISKREILGKGSAVPLGEIGAFMAANVGTTKYKPAAKGTEPGVNAYVYSSNPRQNAVFLGPGWYGSMPVFASPEDALANCRIGSLIHEFAHLATFGKIRDTQRNNSYGELCLFFQPYQALLNADNYRLAVQGVVLGLNL